MHPFKAVLFLLLYETWLRWMWFVEFLGGALWCLFIVDNCFFSEEMTNVFKSQKRKQCQNFISLLSMAHLQIYVTKNILILVLQSVTIHFQIL